MKIFMHWDMEGTSGLLKREHAWFWDPDIRPEAEMEGRRLLVADVNVAVQAALEAGADEVIACDTHRGGGNFIPEEMLTDPRVTYLWRSRGFQGEEFRWMPGLDGTVDGFMVPGHHAMAGTPGAFLPHTWNLDWADFRVNGQSLGEMGIEACFAGHFGIPVILAHGDEAACREAEGMFPGVVTACVKRAVDHDTCTGLGLEAAHRLLAGKVTEAIAKLRAGQCKPFQPALPMTVSLRMTSAESAEKAAKRPGVTRIDDCTVQGVVSRRADVVNWLLGTGLNMEPPR